MWMLLEGVGGDKMFTCGIEIRLEEFVPCVLVDPCGVFDPWTILDVREGKANGKSDSSKITLRAIYMRFVVGSRQRYPL
jgi:hypothetical protein